MTLETTSMVSPQACMYPITSIKLITTQIMVRMLPQMSANNRSMVTNTQAMERPIFRNNSVFITWKRPIYFPLKKATFFQGQHARHSRCLKISEKVSFNIASEAIYVYILRGQKFVKNAQNGPFW